MTSEIQSPAEQLPVSVNPDILSTETLSTLVAMAPELNKAFATRQIFRTETEARVSVLNDIQFPTKAAKYWQAVREQAVMLEQLAALSFEYRRNEVAIKRCQDRIQNAANPFDLEDAQIDLEEKMLARINMKRIATDRVREIKLWSTIKAEQDDGSFDTENVNTHQLVSYATQFSLMASTVNTANMSSGEVVNLVGQLNSTLARCRELNVLNQVLENLPKGVATHILQLQT